MINIGLIGYGKMGQIRHESFERTGKAKIVMIFEPELQEGEVNCNVAETAESVINSDSVDAVSISVPNHLNFPLTLKALQANKHVFCEKPPAFTVEEVEQLIEAEKVSKCKLMYGFNHRHHDAVVKMKSLIESKQYGKVLWMRGRYGKSVDESYFKTWRAEKDKAGGGILFDQGIHMLDLFLHIGGNFDETHAFISNLYWQMDGIEDNVFAILRNSESGMAASLHSTMTQWRHLFSLEVFLEAGYMVLNGLKTSSGTYGNEELSVAINRTTAPAATWSDEERFLFETDNSWDSEARHFVNAISEELPIEIGTSVDALNVMKLIETIYENERHESPKLNTKLQTARK
jgi:predicted dehydrogenase